MEIGVKRKILIMGLPGAGKTTLANALAPLLNAVVFNADAVRANISRDLGFSHTDRVEHSRRMGWLCDRVVESGSSAIADFICPTAETRAAFGEAFTIWVDRIQEGRFEDTNRMFVAPEHFDLRVKSAGAPAIGRNKRWHGFGPRSTRRNRRRYSSAATSRFMKVINA
jgi:hypothetical protein